MKSTIRFAADQLREARADLARPHPFAAERVGFFHARASNAGAEGWILLPYSYVPVPDDHYIDDPEVGARINGDAIRSQQQAALRGGVSILHIHVHEHSGTPSFSMVDNRANLPLLTAFRNASPQMPHAAIVLSHDSALATILVPGAAALEITRKIVEVGRPTRFLQGEGELYG